MHDSVIEASYSYRVSKLEKLKTVFNNIIKLLGNLFFIFLVGVILVTLIYSIYTKKNGVSGSTPLVSAYVIISPSMAPTINVADAVVAYKPNPKNLKKGDIITFSSTDARYTGLTVTHRILQVVNDEVGIRKFRTKGDNNTTADDSLVNSENIYGKVIFVIPWLGYLQFFLTKSYGWILLVVLPCIGIIIYDILKLTKTLKKSKITSNIQFKDIEILDLEEDVVEEKPLAKEVLEYHNDTEELLDQGMLDSCDDVEEILGEEVKEDSDEIELL